MKEHVRRLNFFSTSFTAILGFSLAAEIFQEDDFPDKIDDVVLLLLGIIAIWWYKTRGHSSSSSRGSLILLGLSLITKVGAIIIEHGDAEAVGDDIGVSIALLLSFLFTVWQTVAHKKVS